MWLWEHTWHNLGNGDQTGYAKNFQRNVWKFPFLDFYSSSLEAPKNLHFQSTFLDNYDMDDL